MDEHPVADRVSKEAFLAPWLAGCCGALGVAAGAFGAHGLRGTVTARALEVWQTAARYHLIHAVLLLGLAMLLVRDAGATQAGRRGARWATGCVALGIALFSGSLYAMVLSGQRWLGAITPVGGVVLMVGWVVSAWALAGRRG